MTFLEKQNALAYRAERRRRKWEQDHMWPCFWLAVAFLVGYVATLKAWDIL